MRRFVCIWVAVLLWVAIAQSGAEVGPASGSEDTLKYYLGRSHLVVLGKIVTEPRHIVGAYVIPGYLCSFEVEDVLKGDSNLKGKAIDVDIVQFELDKADKNPLIEKDRRCILFLKKSEDKSVSWQTADIWFGIHYPSPTMVKSLKRLAREE